MASQLGSLVSDAAMVQQLAQHFALDLLLGAEEVRVVLRKTSYSREAPDFAALFPAVYGAEFRQGTGRSR